VPPDVLKARNDRQNYLELLDMLKSIKQTPLPKVENLERTIPLRKPTHMSVKKYSPESSVGGANRCAIFV
jgi:hypothetical protein